MYNYEMQLDEFLKKNSLSVREFAQASELSLDAVYKYLRGERKPRDEGTLARIIAATNGQVTLTDFYDLPTPKPTRKKNGGGDA